MVLFALDQLRVGFWPPGRKKGGGGRGLAAPEPTESMGPAKAANGLCCNRLDFTPSPKSTGTAWASSFDLRRLVYLALLPLLPRSSTPSSTLQSLIWSWVLRPPPFFFSSHLSRSCLPSFFFSLSHSPSSHLPIALILPLRYSLVLAEPAV